MEEPLLLLCLCCRYYEPASFSPCSTSVREEIRSCNEKWTKPNSWGRECYFLSPKCNPFPLYFMASKKGLEYMSSGHCPLLPLPFLATVSVSPNELLFRWSGPMKDWLWLLSSVVVVNLQFNFTFVFREESNGLGLLQVLLLFCSSYSDLSLTILSYQMWN